MQESGREVTRTARGGLPGPNPVPLSLPPSFLPQVIYMARNPKDLVVSYYQFHRSLRTMSYRGTFQEFCRRFMNDKRKCLRLHGRCSSDTSARPTPVCARAFFTLPPVLTMTMTTRVGPALPHR